jgi:iron complex transport system substrate-binding protein
LTTVLDAPQIAADGTRREFVAGGLSLGALVLAGCGEDDDAPAASAGGGADFPVNVEHRYGSTKVPAEPQRVVTVGLYDQDACFAVGVEPVASQRWYADRVVYPWAAEAVPGAETELLPGEELDVESVAAENPDLIVGISTDLTREQYDQLSQLAPTIAAPRGTDAVGTTWRQQTEQVGRALGREGRARERIARVERAFAAAARRHPEWNGASAVVASQYIGGQLLVYPASSPASDFLTDLGFEIAPGLDEFTNDEFGVPALSAERFDLIDVDLVLWDGLRKNLAAAGLFDVPTYQALDIVEEGRQVFPASLVADALSFRNVLSLPWALERLEPPMAAAFDGDPATS